MYMVTYIFFVLGVRAYVRGFMLLVALALDLGAVVLVAVTVK